MMVDGTRHEFTGFLATAGAELSLQMSDSRSWILRWPLGLDRFVGRYVRVNGVRSGAELHVDHYSAV
jgi:hypothetical protein